MIFYYINKPDKTLSYDSAKSMQKQVTGLVQICVDSGVTPLNKPFKMSKISLRWQNCTVCTRLNTLNYWQY